MTESGKPKIPAKGRTRSALKPSKSRLIRSIQSAYADAGKPLAEVLAKQARVSPTQLRLMLLNGVCPATIAWVERLLDALDVQMVLMPKRRHASSEADGAEATLDIP